MGNCTGSGTHPSTCPMLPSGRDHLLAAISHFFPSIQANVPSPTTLFPLLILSYSLEWPWFVICNQPVIRDSFSLLFAICKQLGGSIKKKKKKIPKNPALSSHAWHNHSHKEATAGQALFSPTSAVLDPGATMLQGAAATRSQVQHPTLKALPSRRICNSSHSWEVNLSFGEFALGEKEKEEVSR